VRASKSTVNSSRGSSRTGGGDFFESRRRNPRFCPSRPSSISPPVGRLRDSTLILLREMQHCTDSTNSMKVIDFAIQKRLPSMFQEKGWAVAGGLMSYGENLPSMYRRAAYFVDKIFKGAKPADLPVEQATKFDMVLNLKTAKAIGLTRSRRRSGRTKRRQPPCRKSKWRA
jgi:hypothetical protein